VWFALDAAAAALELILVVGAAAALPLAVRRRPCAHWHWPLGDAHYLFVTLSLCARDHQYRHRA
jgi:hypothetical protein